MNTRIWQIESIRGMASLCVLFSHFYSVLNGTLHTTFTILFTLTPFKSLINGHSAVILFFVLSGFVLSIPILEKKEINYMTYLIKRIFRIYIPYLASILFAIILEIFFTGKQIDISRVIEHVLFLGNIHSNTYNGVIWSLIHEMRISLLFPFVVLFIQKFNLKINLGVCFLLSLFAGLNNIYHFQLSNGFFTTYFNSIQYLAIFILGSLLAKHRNKLIEYYNNFSTTHKCILLLVALVFYSFSDVAIIKILQLSYEAPYFLILNEYGIAIGGIGLIITSLSSTRVAKILMIKPITFMGKTSYSLYLFHLPILINLRNFLQESTSLWLICLISFVLTLIISTSAWYLIENPCMNTGRNIANRIKLKRINLKTNDIIQDKFL